MLYAIIVLKWKETKQTPISDLACNMVKLLDRHLSFGTFMIKIIQLSTSAQHL